MSKKPDDAPVLMAALAPSASREKSERLKAARLENDKAVALRVAKATRKARVRRDILGK